MAASPKPETQGLNYPYGNGWSPEIGEPFKITDGVYQLRMPLPFAPGHINLWLLEDGDGWTVVDTGIDTDECKAIWNRVFDGLFQGRPIKQVAVTHMHADHLGLAGWLTEQFNCPLWMTREEFFMAKTLVHDTDKEAPEAAIRFYRGAGYNDDQIKTYKNRFGHFGRGIYPMPSNYRRIVDREVLSINGNHWQVLVSSGHSVEHAALYCPGLKLLISGDQVLPRITPMVGVFPLEPWDDPLRRWLLSCDRLRDLVPDDVLVLPSHQELFFGLHVRINQILESHEQGLKNLLALLTEPKRAIDCFEALFKRKITGNLFHLATVETLAHLNCLLARKQIVCRRDSANGDIYQQR